VSLGIKETLGRDEWGVTTEPTFAKGIGVSSAVMVGIKDEGVIEAKDKESGDIWCEAQEFKIHSECDIPEKLWGNWPTEEEANIVYSYKERNFWNCSIIILGSVKEPDKTTAVLIDCGGL